MSDRSALNYSVLLVALRQKYASNLEGLRAEVTRVLALALGSQVVLTASSSEGASQSGEIVLTRMEYLAVLIDLQAELDPNFVQPSGGNGVIRYADHSSRYAE